MIERTKILALTGALALLGTGAALAADYIFIVPVDVKAMSSDFKYVDVRCNLYSERGGVVGGQNERRDLAGGSFVGDVKVVVKHDEKRAVLPKKWDCILVEFSTTAGTKHRLHEDAKRQLRFEPDIPADTKAPRVIRVEGNFK